MQTSERIMQELRTWRTIQETHSVPSLGFYAMSGMPHYRSVQQHYDELKAYVDVLEQMNPKEIALEIGFYRGGTHFVWTHLFSEVISIESDYWSCCKAVVEFPSPQSKILYGNSNDTACIQDIERLLNGKQVDHLFIDGAHEYEAVLSDFLNYSRFVRSGGIIGFHDSSLPDSGVIDVLQNLKAGLVHGWPPINLYEINKPKEGVQLGISYFYKR